MTTNYINLTSKEAKEEVMSSDHSEIVRTEKEEGNKKLLAEFLHLFPDRRQRW